MLKKIFIPFSNVSERDSNPYHRLPVLSPESETKPSQMNTDKMRTSGGMPKSLKILIVLVLCTVSASLGRLSADSPLRYDKTSTNDQNQKETRVDKEKWPWNRLPAVAMSEYQTASRLCRTGIQPPRSGEASEPDARPSSSAYLMMAHNEDTIAGLFELLNRIYHPWDTFVIHVDSKANLTYSSALQAHYSHCTNVAFVNPRWNNRWGGWGLVATELAMMQIAFAQVQHQPGVKEWTYGFLIDGATWPRMNRTERLQYLADPKTPDFPSTGNPACEFNKPPGEDCSRTPARCLNEECTQMSYTPKGAVLWKSSQWAVISRPLMEWMLVNDTSQAWQTFLSQHWIPDEFFLGSATLASPFKESNGAPPYIAAAMAVSWSKPNCPSYQDPDSGWKPGSPCYHGNGSYPWLAEQFEPFSRKWYAGDVAKREYLLQLPNYPIGIGG